MCGGVMLARLGKLEVFLGHPSGPRVVEVCRCVTSNSATFHMYGCSVFHLPGGAYKQLRLGLVRGRPNCKYIPTLQKTYDDLTTTVILAILGMAAVLDNDMGVFSGMIFATPKGIKSA
ncbi:hypothetical protein AG1IA_02050 [Rhizoctonia solani AG-1 IA]|uniref:Uncharacterized protein n=1 Tax=Thanatephorus cucumeris (strain AG1-IA) TaxID=983506 RepID=L8X5L6_THACA|nr:hypothetical protein AG1IA_02050 [Rhizoctonia solani AG-1 IA]